MAVTASAFLELLPRPAIDWKVVTPPPSQQVHLAEPLATGARRRTVSREVLRAVRLIEDQAAVEGLRLVVGGRRRPGHELIEPRLACRAWNVRVNLAQMTELTSPSTSARRDSPCLLRPISEE